MRLIIVIFIATMLAAATQMELLETRNAARTQPQDKIAMNGHQAYDSRNGTAGSDHSAADDSNILDWLLLALNRVLIYVLAGWGFGRISFQFRKAILIVIGLVVVVDFILTIAGIIDIKVRWENLESVFTTLKRLVKAIGIVECVSLILGVWAGGRGARVAERRLQATSA